MDNTLITVLAVFAGLIVLIYILKAIRAYQERLAAQEAREYEEQKAPAVTRVPNRGAFVAAVSAAIAEVLGKDVSGLRIVSIKRVG